MPQNEVTSAGAHLHVWGFIMSSYEYYRGSDMDSPYNDCDLTPEDFGYIKMTDVPDIEWVKLQTLRTIEAIYETGDLDVMEDALDELCSALKIKIPKAKPLLTKAV